MDKIEITPQLLSDLKEKAEKATPGPWVSDEVDGTIETEDGSSIVIEPVEVVDAAYIAAANPQVVLALIEQIEELEARNTRLKIELHDLDSSGEEMAKDYRQLEKEADWLAMELEKREHGCEWCEVSNCSRYSSPCGYKGPDNWREAARRAVEE